MRHIKTFIGVDISKNTLDLAIIKRNNAKVIKTIKIENAITDLKKLKTELKAEHIELNKQTLVTMEDTGPYKNILLKFLKTQTCEVCVESALRIKRSLGLVRGKSDCLDSKNIARYALVHEKELVRYNAQRAPVMMLKKLLTLRQRFLKIKLMAKTPLKELERFDTRKNIQFINKLSKPIVSNSNLAVKEVTREINALCRDDEALRHKIKLITSVPGVGPLTAQYLLYYTNEFTRCSNHLQLASYMGIAPFEHSSGTSVKGTTRVSHIANKKMKTLLHLSAVATIRKTGAFKKYYDRKIKEGKKAMVVINNIRNKIVKRIWLVIQQDRPYIKGEKTYQVYKARMSKQREVVAIS
jgi:transposase